MSTHIFVQREPERQYYPAPSAVKCRTGLVKTDMRAYECCIAATEALILVMTDLKKVLERETILISNFHLDTADLLLLTNYLLLWPLKEATRYVDILILQHEQTPGNLPESSREEKRQLRQRHKEYFKKWDKLFHMTVEIEEALLSLHNIQPIRERLRQFLVRDDQDVPNIPALGVVELLLRVVAEAEESNLIGAN
ncbi:MAG: hypothetical protein Q9214_005256 [Letrouitia sp. 1 TL-2023]